MTRVKKDIVCYLQGLDIEVNGNRPHDIQVLDERVYDLVYKGGTKALGETFEMKMWDTHDLDTLAEKFILERMKDSKTFRSTFLERCSIVSIPDLFINPQSPERSYQVAVEHYDLGNSFFESFLGKEMHYTSGIWSPHCLSLDEAQDDKIEFIAKKISLRPGMRVLDLGCGWGGVSRALATRYDVLVTGITNSVQQFEYCQQKKNSPLLDYKYGDYRRFQATSGYDAVIALGFVEAVGAKNYRTLFTLLNHWLSKDGQIIIETTVDTRKYAVPSPWLSTYIFPNGQLPTLYALVKAMSELFVLKELHDISHHYDRTLGVWWQNFDRNQQCRRCGSPYAERFLRRWRFYLQGVRPVYRTGFAQELIIVLEKNGYLKLRDA
jgi:cyclopropane-fatty-acyl-phospholipid synthase